MSKKKIIIGSVAGVLMMSLAVYWWVNRGGGYASKKEINPMFREYISAFTSGYISNESTIRILLTNEYTQPIEIGKEIDEKLFSFSPGIEGKAYWLDNRTIEFKPANRLPSGQSYEAEFYLSKLMEVPSGFKTFEFDFTTIPMQVNVYMDGVTTIDKKTLRWQLLKGVLTTSDAANTADVEKIVTATQDDRKLKIYWEHLGNTHNFKVDSVERKKSEGKVIISWDADVLGLNTKGTEEVIIPSLSDFKVLEVKVEQTPEQCVVIQFSDPILERQELDGLITITGTNSLKYIISENDIKVYSANRLAGTHTLNISPGVQNVLGYSLKEAYTETLVFEEIKPQVKISGKGVILPNSNGLNFPFEAVNLKAVDVKIVRIYEKNVLQFLQVNNLSGDRELKRVGKTILKKTVQLNVNNAIDANKWNSYSLDLSQLIKAEPGAIYKVILSFRQEYSTYTCEGKTTDYKPIQVGPAEYEDADDANWEYQSSYYYDYDYYDYYDEYEEGGDDYNYNERNNPCNSSYYQQQRDISRNVLASDIGILAKRGTNGSMLIAVTDLITTKPISGVEIEVYDYQQQVLNKQTTDADGLVKLDMQYKPFVIVAKKGEQRGYLKMDEGASLSLSMFDVSGEVVQNGIKGYIYGERGVWRPGDTLFLTFVLEDKLKLLPENHPVAMELINPMGQVVKKTIKSNSLNGFYNFTTVTEDSYPTGNWEAKVRVGGVTFSKAIKIETVMPNRLKIKLDFGTDLLTANDNNSGKMEVKWLHGTVAKNLKTKIDVVLSQMTTTFKGYDDYTFDDASKTYYSESQTVFEDNVDAEGKADVVPEINVEGNAPGMLKAYFTVRVFEEGGAFSIDRFNLPFSPYSSYVGMKVPEVNPQTRMLVTDTNNVIKVVTVNEKGLPVTNNNLKVEVYKVRWRWWWDSYDDDLANYVGNSYHQPYQTHTISTVNGKGQFIFRVNRPDWGRFFVRITDLGSGHTTGREVYVDWPYGSGSSPKGNEGASLLTFTSDKKVYNVGETAKITIPTGENGRALISVESGSKVIQTQWVETQKGKTEYELKVTEEMSPNVYINVTLLQPHSAKVNDLPIRLYGVIPVQVEDPLTHLKPKITTADVWRPEQKTSITVKEENGRAMTYTLAVVDDGLLDLTRFKTPDLWSVFYAREALGVKTWDMYDLVMGAYGGQIDRILSIGGDGDVNRKGGNKANRFKPMVKFFGPFYLEKGEKATHEFMVPQYVGSVRVMLISGQDAAYGFDEKTVTVKSPLMVLGTLPRVLGPGESVELPVSVFALEKSVKNVNVQILPNQLLEVEGESSKQVSFAKEGDEVVGFRLKVKSTLGVAKVKIAATSGSEKANYEIELDVRNPNPKITDIVETTIQAGQTWNQAYKPIGISGTNTAVLEVSSIPPINLKSRLKYLLDYPHGCVEQTTSSVFPQLYLSEIMELNDAEKKRASDNVKAGIQRLRGFQTSTGGMAYWPGMNDEDEWGSNYAGHFLIEAELKGYTLPLGLLDNWKRYQRREAQSWTGNKGYGYGNDELVQAYRLYTLALAKSPEMGAMNRLKETVQSATAKWRLAAAYALAGQTEVAKKLINNLDTKVAPYTEMWYTYGSSQRDIAMILETLSLLKDKNKSFLTLKELAVELSKDQWMSTQTTAYCLLAVSKYISGGAVASKMKYNIKVNNENAVTVSDIHSIRQETLKVNGISSGNVQLRNESNGVLFARIILEGIPETGDQTSAENNLKMEVKYMTANGSPIDVSMLEQGTDFVAEVTLKNPGLSGEYKQMALMQIFPSGWEILNSRMAEDGEVESVNYTYRDVRDDRVMTYFNLPANKTVVYRVSLNAAYAGRYYLPSTTCEAMYDNTINARRPGKWIEVVKPGGSL